MNPLLSFSVRFPRKLRKKRPQSPSNCHIQNIIRGFLNRLFNLCERSNSLTISIRLCRQIIVLGLPRTYLWEILLVSKIENCLRHRFVGGLSYRHSPPEILLSTSVSPLTSWNSVSLDPLGPAVWSLSSCCTRSHESSSTRVVVILIEVLSSATLLLWGRTVEVVKHQVHVCSLLFLQVVNNCFIPMHLYFNVCLSLAGKSAGLMEVIVRLLLTRLLLLGYHWGVQCIICPSSI